MGLYLMVIMWRYVSKVLEPWLAMTRISVEVELVKPQGSSGGECLLPARGVNHDRLSHKDCIEARIFIEKISVAQLLIANKGYDNQIMCDEGKTLGTSAIILRKTNSVKSNRGLSRPLYKLRHLMENASA